MKTLGKILLLSFLLIFSASKAFCVTAWINDMRAVYLSNKAVIYAINIRTFNANDIDGDGIIEEDKGETRGSFTSAVERLDELVALGINTVQLLPVTSVGKTKAIGTAGSLYAPSSFTEINPQLKTKNGNLPVSQEMRLFIDECHNRNLRVIVDLPCCASYDLYLKHPELFLKDSSQNPIVPADWTDVRLLDAGTETQVNQDVYNLYKDFLDIMMLLNVDGVRADMAGLKPYSFWKKLIDYTRAREPQFLFLAQSSPLDQKLNYKSPVFTPYNRLLDAGFDGCYGRYSEFKNWTKAKDFMSSVKSDYDIQQKYLGTKSVLANFSTHDQISPILINGPTYSKMLIWLSATLPLNSYFVDGFVTGDDYIYPLANKKASKTYTDDEFYFVHRGQLDIFNFSRKPAGKYYDILHEFLLASRFKKVSNKLVAGGNFLVLRTSCPSVFAYARILNKQTIVVIGNLDFKNEYDVTVYVPRLSKNILSIPITIKNIPKIDNGKITTSLDSGEIQVLSFEGFNLK